MPSSHRCIAPDGGHSESNPVTVVDSVSLLFLRPIDSLTYCRSYSLLFQIYCYGNRCFAMCCFSQKSLEIVKYNPSRHFQPKNLHWHTGYEWHVVYFERERSDWNVNKICLIQTLAVQNKFFPCWACGVKFIFFSCTRRCSCSSLFPPPPSIDRSSPSAASIPWGPFCQCPPNEVWSLFFFFN